MRTFLVPLLFALPCFGQALNCAPAPSGLVGWWQAEGNARDGVGTNNGIISGGLTFRAGEVGQAFSFGLQHSDVTVPASASLNVGAGGGLTLEAWIKPNDTAGTPIFDWSPNGAYGALFWVNASSSALYGNLVDSGGGYHIIQSGGGLLTTDGFQHVALTYDKASGTARLFLNGFKVAESNLGTFTPQTSTDLQLGYHLPGAPFGEYMFNGSIDEASIYNRALGSNEIYAIYSAGSAGKCVAASAPYITSQPQSQVGYWGSTVTFTVQVNGTAPLSYLWYKDGFSIAWATNSALVLTNLALDAGGNYSVVVTNLFGSVASPNAFLTVNPAGVALGLYPGITIQGTPGNNYGIQYTTNLSSSVTWISLTQITLTQPIEMWIDSSNNVAEGTNPRRFYRVVALP